MMFDKILINKTKKLLTLALAKKIKIVSAESCTGGLISALITEISGSSKVFDSGFIVYSNLSKVQNLDVSHETLEKFGAVSKEVAKEMAIGAIKNSSANLSIAVTGIAGPQSDDTAKSVGLVYIASYNGINDCLIVKEFNFNGQGHGQEFNDRFYIRINAVVNAVEILINQIENCR